jgi:hypothetical protein
MVVHMESGKVLFVTQQGNSLAVLIYSSKVHFGLEKSFIKILQNYLYNLSKREILYNLQE